MKKYLTKYLYLELRMDLLLNKISKRNEAILTKKSEK